MDEKERRYQVACKLLNVTDEKPINRKPRNPARGFKILKGLEAKGWHFTPDEVIAFSKHYETMNKAREVYGDKPFSPPANVQGWHNVLVQWRYSEGYEQFIRLTAPVIIVETQENKQPFSKEKMDTIMKLMVEGFRSNRVDRLSKIDEIQGVLNDGNSNS